MPRPLPVTTATFPSRFMAPTLVIRREAPLCELDFEVLATGLVPRLPVDRVRDRIGCICEEHGVRDVRPLDCESGHLVGEPPPVSVVAVRRRRVHGTDASDAGGVPISDHANDLPIDDPDIEVPAVNHVAGYGEGIGRGGVLDLGAEALE